MKNNKEAKFAVIGGQYSFIDYGTTATLHAAKCLAAKHEEFWDNYQGWHRPSIYRIEDTAVTEDRNRYPRHEYQDCRYLPVAVWDGKKWVDPGQDED